MLGNHAITPVEIRATRLSPSRTRPPGQSEMNHHVFREDGRCASHGRTSIPTFGGQHPLPQVNILQMNKIVFVKLFIYNFLGWLVVAEDAPFLVTVVLRLLVVHYNG